MIIKCETCPTAMAIGMSPREVRLKLFRDESVSLFIKYISNPGNFIAVTGNVDMLVTVCRIAKLLLFSISSILLIKGRMSYFTFIFAKLIDEMIKILLVSLVCFEAISMP